MSRSETKLTNYAAIAARDKQAAALVEATGCSFADAWAAVLDAEERRQDDVKLRDRATT